MAIGDGLCDPETMTDYGDFLFGIGLIDEDDRDYFAKVAKLQQDYIKQQKWFQAFQVRWICNIVVCGKMPSRQVIISFVVVLFYAVSLSLNLPLYISIHSSII